MATSELLRQWNIALLADKEQLIRENNNLRDRIQEIETNNAQLIEENNNLKELNNALKIVLRETEDERDHYKALNIAEFDNFISNYIFGLFNNISL